MQVFANVKIIQILSKHKSNHSHFSLQSLLVSIKNDCTFFTLHLCVIDYVIKKLHSIQWPAHGWIIEAQNNCCVAPRPALKPACPSWSIKATLLMTIWSIIFVTVAMGVVFHQRLQFVRSPFKVIWWWCLSFNHMELYLCSIIVWKCRCIFFLELLLSSFHSSFISMIPSIPSSPSILLPILALRSPTTKVMSCLRMSFSARCKVS